MILPVFAKVELTEDIIEFNLKKGSIGTIVEHYPMPEPKEDGYSIEGLIDQDTVEVAESQIRLINYNQTQEKATVFFSR